MTSRCAAFVDSAGLALNGSKLRMMNRKRFMFLGFNSFLEHLNEFVGTTCYLVFLHRLHIAESHRPSFVGMIEPVIDLLGKCFRVFGGIGAMFVEGIGSSSGVFRLGNHRHNGLLHGFRDTHSLDLDIGTMDSQVGFSRQLAELFAVVEAHSGRIVDHSFFVELVRHAGVFIEFGSASGYMQADPFGILAEADSPEEGGLVFLDGSTAYINEIQRPVGVPIIVRRCFGSETGVRYHSVGDSDTMRFDMVA